MQPRLILISAAIFMLGMADAILDGSSGSNSLGNLHVDEVVQRVTEPVVANVLGTTGVLKKRSPAQELAASGPHYGMPATFPSAAVHGKAAMAHVPAGKSTSQQDKRSILDMLLKSGGAAQPAQSGMGQAGSGMNPMMGGMGGMGMMPPLEEEDMDGGHEARKRKRDYSKEARRTIVARDNQLQGTVLKTQMEANSLTSDLEKALNSGVSHTESLADGLATGLLQSHGKNKGGSSSGSTMATPPGGTPAGIGKPDDDKSSTSSTPTPPGGTPAGIDKADDDKSSSTASNAGHGQQGSAPSDSDMDEMYGQQMMPPMGADPMDMEPMDMPLLGPMDFTMPPNGPYDPMMNGGPMGSPYFDQV
ncbi:hypothetical protein BC940DRAFT_368616 [Gongronella butleri]|nr:hypothetical protein BC940DRAFT_368616 [Gongronella butleri]